MKISESIYIVAGGSFGVGISNPYDCNVYLVDCGEGFALIDCGAGLDTAAILRNIENSGFSPGDCRIILLTHAHADHAGGAMELNSATGATVWAFGESARFVSEGDLEAISLRLAIDCGVYPVDYAFHACSVNEARENQRFTVGGITFSLIPTSGHSAGHCSYLAEIDGKNVLFGGDCVFLNGKIALQPIWDCSVIEYADSLRRLSALNVDALLPSHHGFVMSGGQNHIKAAHEKFSQLGVPPNAG